MAIPAHPTTVACFQQVRMMKRLVALFAIRKSLVVTFFTIVVAAFFIRVRVFDNVFASGTLDKIILKTIVAKIGAERFNPPHVVCVVITITTVAVRGTIRTVASIPHPSSIILVDTCFTTVA